LARTDFRAQAARRLSEDTELSPAIVSLLTPDSPTRSVGVRIVQVDHIEPNPEQPRMVFEQAALDELAASIREHGVLQPILVRPLGPNTYQIVAGERRWRASRQAGLATIPALIEDIDDDTALEIAIIENLQREDLTPLDEAAMYDRMVHEHGYSIRKLADKLGKDKGYLENRLRLADAPPEIRELVSLRKDSLSHAYELMKVEDPKKRRRLAEQVARGELTLIKLRDKIEGRRSRPEPVAGEAADTDAAATPARKTISRLQHDVLPAVAGSVDQSTEITLGGVAAEDRDFVHAVYGNFPYVLGFVILLTFVLLMRAFRSIILPLKAVLLNLISLGCAFGVVVFIFQWGHGSDAIWGIKATHAVISWIPLMIFAFLFGLSMDYEVFIVTRIREAYDETKDTAKAVGLGLARTGKLVTSASLVLVFAFFSLSTGPGPDIKQFGIGLAAGVLIDATLIRALLVPSVMLLLGRANWWFPERVRRVLLIPAREAE